MDCFDARQLPVCQHESLHGTNAWTSIELKIGEVKPKWHILFDVVKLTVF